MLKSAMYINVFILFIMSIFFLVKVFDKTVELKKLRQLIIIYIIYNFISIVFCSSEIVEVDWYLIFLFPISAISFIIYNIGICCTNKRIKKLNNVNSTNLQFKKIVIIIIIPILIFIIPYMYELYIINKCSYLLKYNYQNGIIQSDDTYIAIINNKPVTITLQKNLFNRKGNKGQNLIYDIAYNDIIEISTNDYEYNKIIIKNEEIERIALNAKEKCQFAKSASLDYFPEKKYAIITLLSEDGYGTVLGEYFYYNSTYIQNINTHGSLESITYYE